MKTTRKISYQDFIIQQHKQRGIIRPKKLRVTFTRHQDTNYYYVNLQELKEKCKPFDVVTYSTGGFFQDNNGRFIQTVYQVLNNEAVLSKHKGYGLFVALSPIIL